MKKKLFNVNEVAEYLAVSTSAIRKWIRTAQIPFVRVNGSVRFDIDEIDKWTSGNKRAAVNA